MSSKLQLPYKLVPIFLKAQNTVVVSLLTGWGFMASPALRMWATSPDISHQLHLQTVIDWLALGSPLSWSLLAWWRIKGPMVWPWTLGTGAGTLYGTRKLWIPLLKVTTLHTVVSTTIPGSVATDAETDKSNAINTMTSMTITTFNQLQSKPLVCMASPLPLSWAVFRLAKKLIDISGNPRERQWLHQHQLSFRILGGPLRLNKHAADNIFSSWI